MPASPLHSSSLPPDSRDQAQILETLVRQLGSLASRLERLAKAQETPATSQPAGELQELLPLLNQTLPLLQALSRQIAALSQRLPGLQFRPQSLLRSAVPGIIPGITAVLLLLTLLTFLRPHWLLPPSALRTYELGRDLEEVYPRLSSARRSQLRELLWPSSTTP